MDPNLHHTPLHWGYTSTPTQNHWTPPQTRSAKRALSDSDCDELYSEESSKEHISPESDSCHQLSRKKRRGVIEKKRRDRINSSLSELKRLVPSAYEKQGSAKLEKAEILQLTVEHLKSLHAKGLDSMAYDPQRFAMDYHIIGFRECASEVARYLVTIEGMDIQDPLRLRLMSHLQYFVQQRELSAKACSSPNWSSTSYQANCTPPTYQAYPAQTAASSNSYIPNLPPPIQPIQPAYHSTLVTPPASMHHHHGIPHSSRTSATTSVTETSSLMSVPVQHQSHLQQQQQHSQQQVTASANQQLSPSHDPHQHPQQRAQQPTTQHYPTEHDHPHHDHQGTRTYIDLTANDHQSQQQQQQLPTADIAGGYGSGSQYHAPATAQGYNPTDNVNYNGNGAKPYRPWGAEMAY